MISDVRRDSGKAAFEVLLLKYRVAGGGGGANTKVPDMYGVGGGVFSGPETQK